MKKIVAAGLALAVILVLPKAVKAEASDHDVCAMVSKEKVSSATGISITDMRSSNSPETGDWTCVYSPEGTAPDSILIIDLDTVRADYTLPRFLAYQKLETDLCRKTSQYLKYVSFNGYSGCVTVGSDVEVYVPEKRTVLRVSLDPTQKYGNYPKGWLVASKAIAAEFVEGYVAAEIQPTPNR